MPYLGNKIIQNLNQAIERQDKEKIKNLLDELDEKSINDYDCKDPVNKRRPIDCAVEYGDPEIVRLICEKKPELNVACESTGNFPIHTIVLRDSKQKNANAQIEQILDILSQNQADFNAKTIVGKNTLLHLLAIQLTQGENIESIIAHVIYQYDCKLNEYNLDFKTPLQILVEKFGSRHMYSELYEQAGGKLQNDATMQFREKLNKRNKSNKPLLTNPFLAKLADLDKIAPPGVPPLAELMQLWEPKASRNSHVEKQYEVAQNSVAEMSFLSSPKVKQNVQVNSILVLTHAKALKTASDANYQKHLDKLQQQANKDAYIEAIIQKCEADNTNSSDSRRSAERIEQLQTLKTPTLKLA